MKHPPSHPANRARKPSSVRIIGGSHKRSLLPVLDAEGLRPTSDRVRETLFNWLGQDLRGWRCIDAFSGTGALGFEAASRGAADVLLVEQNTKLALSLNATATRLKLAGVRVERGDGVLVLGREAGRKWDAVFLDPPFSQASGDLFARALRACRACLKPSGVCYLEAPLAWSPDALAALGWALEKQGQAGAVYFHLLKPVSSDL